MKAVQMPAEGTGSPGMTATTQTSKSDPALAWPAPRGTAAITLDDVTVTYSGPGHRPRTVLAGINLTVPAGEFIALVGRSGCGKTTLLNLVA